MYTSDRNLFVIVNQALTYCLLTEYGGHKYHEWVQATFKWELTSAYIDVCISTVGQVVKVLLEFYHNLTALIESTSS